MWMEMEMGDEWVAALLYFYVSGVDVHIDSMGLVLLLRYPRYGGEGSCGRLGTSCVGP